MPGTRLNDTERRLADFWDNPPAQFVRPLLRQIRLEGALGLRGVQRLVMPFPYPLTVISGRNGAGKSTILGLTAISARPPDDWSVFWGNTRPRTNPNARKRYEFRDFFHRRRGDPHPNGLRLTWVLMDRGNETEFSEEMRNARWVVVRDADRHQRPVRPVREIDYIPMARVLPAAEFGLLRTAFAAHGQVEQTIALAQATLAELSYIMGRQYQQAETGFIRGLGLANCTAAAPYTGFDMGSGESSLIVLLSRLQTAPVGTLVIIEEVELGLHAEAQKRLVEVLLRYCEKKKLQIVCTTHSEVVIDAVPRRARVLLRRTGDGIEAIDNVSTRFAVHEMAGEAQPEVMIYCEDRFAAQIIEECLAGPTRTRVKIQDIGSNVTLARQSVAHMRMQGIGAAVSAFDGDCTEAEISGWINAERAGADIHPVWTILPGDGLPPERWLVGEFANPVYRDRLRDALNCTDEVVQSHIEAMTVQLDQHHCGRVLSNRTGLSQDIATQFIIRSVARDHPSLAPLQTLIADRLAGAA